MKGAVRRGLAALGLEVWRIPRTGAPRQSFFDEERILRDLLRAVPVGNEFYVDIGAGNGELHSNTVSLARSGWSGLAVECDGARFVRMAHRYRELPGIRLSRARVTPANVVSLLAAHDVPRDFAFLNLDIDSFDYFVLQAILGAYRPAIMCVEINEKIPPPIRFTVNWDPSHQYAGDHFYGMSLALLEDLAIRHRYALVALEYNSAFLVAQDVATMPAVAAATAYRAGYIERADRLDRLPWNRDMEHLLHVPPADAIVRLRRAFERYEGRFVCSDQPIDQLGVETS